MSKHFHKLNVHDVISETKEAVSLSFDIPPELEDTFQFNHGQYVTLKFTINGNEVRRAYSMCTSPLEGRTVVTVKRIQNGLVSNYINDNIKAGDQIEVMPPQGRFFTELDPSQSKTYYLFGGGSGITPLMSILKTVIEKEPKSVVHLFYGNRDESSIIFKKELDQLCLRYEGQLTVDYILSDPIQEKQKGLSGLFKRPVIKWQGKVGLPDENNIRIFLQEHPSDGREAEYFICGPTPMMDIVESVLPGNGIDKKSIHIERFSSTPPHEATAKPASAGTAGTKLIVHLEGNTIETSIPSGKTILNTLLEGKHDPPYSCTAGACATCMAKLIRGKVKMDACYALDEDEIKQGFILTCQSHPTTDEVELTFDV